MIFKFSIVFKFNFNCLFVFFFYFIYFFVILFFLNVWNKILFKPKYFIVKAIGEDFIFYFWRQKGTTKMSTNEEAIDNIEIEENKDNKNDTNEKEDVEIKEISKKQEKYEKIDETTIENKNFDKNEEYFLAYNQETREQERVYLHSNPKLTINEEEEYYVGIDEAGRGPVMGPLVYSCAYFPVSQKTKLNSLQFQDSKKLTEIKRWNLFRKVQTNNVGYQVNIIRPIDISEQFYHSIDKSSLNKISHERTVETIESLLKLNMKIKEIYVDTVGTAKDYEKYLQAKFPEVPTIVVSIKADSIYPIVSAASICAKVIRDLILKHWIFPETLSLSQRNDRSLLIPFNGINKSNININNNKNNNNNNNNEEEEDKEKENNLNEENKEEKKREEMKEYEREFGSGYPGDPITKKWLEKAHDPIFGYPSIVRFSWKTTEKLLEKRCFSVFWEHEDQLELLHNNKKKKTMNSPASKRVSDHHSKLAHRYHYFATRGMNTSSSSSML